MIGLYDGRSQLIGWTDQELEQVLTLDSQPSGFLKPKNRGPGMRINRRHARRVAALDQLRIDRHG